MNIDQVFGLMVELDKLKAVYRQTLLTDDSRQENSAEHSWHLALALLTLHAELKMDIDLAHAIKIALIHDICEIGAGDISVFSPNRDQKQADERAYIQGMKTTAPLVFTDELERLWEEYEAQLTLESRWVKVVDRALPFMLNIANAGKTWQSQGIKRSQVVAINETTKTLAPELYAWMLLKMDLAVAEGWLLEG